MKLLTLILNLLRGHDEETMLDHVPVNSNVAASKLKRARKKAAERHGKPFHAHERKARETEPSAMLQALTPKPIIELPASVPVLAARRAGGAK